MKLQSIDPKVTPFRWGQDRTVGKWSFVDLVWFRTPEDQTDRYDLREVRHYGTLMGNFVRSARLDRQYDVFNGVSVPELGEWFFEPVSTGWGSVSDQQGMNKIMHGYGWYYRRAGGAEYVELSTNNTEKVGN